MAKGRKPKGKNIIPLTGGIANAEERAAQTALKLKPKNLPASVAAEWDVVAPVLAAPHIDRVKPHFVPAIIEMCHLLARVRAIRGEYPDIKSETYETEGRNGIQVKVHPHVAQLNDAMRQLRGYFAAFGMTPSDERNLAPGQGNLFDAAAEFD